MTHAPRIIDIECLWLHETEKGVKIATDEESTPVWLPKHLVEIDAPLTIPGAICTITLPERLAIEKGLA